MAVDGSDSNTGLLGDRCHRDFLAVAPDRDRGGGEDAFAVGRGSLRSRCAMGCAFVDASDIPGG